MAVQRDRPYVQFNFLVDLGTGDTTGPEAGFQEINADAIYTTNMLSMATTSSTAADLQFGPTGPGGPAI